MSIKGFCQSGHNEVAKGSVHGMLASLLAVTAVYNGIAYYHRRERHLAINTLAYTVGFVFEVGQVRRHVEHNK